MRLQAKIYGKHDRGFLKFRNKIESLVARCSPRSDSAAADGLIERDSLGGVQRSYVFFVLNVKGEPDIFGFNSEDRDIEQAAMLKWHRSVDRRPLVAVGGQLLVRDRDSEFAASRLILVDEGEPIERGTPGEENDKGRVALAQRRADRVVVHHEKFGVDLPLGHSRSVFSAIRSCTGMSGRKCHKNTNRQRERDR